ncbi:hypothetical protein Ntsu_57180 [Nocardia sp. IFM 10818]
MFEPAPFQGSLPWCRGTVYATFSREEYPPGGGPAQARMNVGFAPDYSVGPPHPLSLSAGTVCAVRSTVTMQDLQTGQSTTQTVEVPWSPVSGGVSKDVFMPASGPVVGIVSTNPVPDQLTIEV